MAPPFHDSAGSSCAHHQLEETPRSCVVMQYSPGDHKVGKQEGLSHGMFKLSLNSLQGSRLRARIKIVIAHSILSWIAKVGLVMGIQCRLKGLRVSSPGLGILFGPAGNLGFRLLQIGKQGQAFPIPLQETALHRGMDINGIGVYETQILIDRSDLHRIVIVGTGVVPATRNGKLLSGKSSTRFQATFANDYT